MPAGNCRCGLYAFHDPSPAPSPGIVGAIKAHGQVESHADGFRPQYGEIVALVYRGRRPSRRELRAADRYEVPLVPLRDLEAAATEHGRALSPSQRPRRGPWVELFEVFPRLAALHNALARGYVRIAEPLRRHHRCRSAMLLGEFYAPLTVYLLWGYLIALTTRGVDVSALVGWLALLPGVVLGALTVARRMFGSRWLFPPAMWPIAAIPALTVPLQIARDAGVHGLAMRGGRTPRLRRATPWFAA